MRNLTIVLQRDIPSISTDVSGQALASAQPMLERLASKLDIVPLIAFKSERPEAAAKKLRDQGIDPDVVELPKELWYSPNQGLQTVVVLREYLREHPATLPNSSEVIKELDTWCEILAQSCDKMVAWHLSVEF